MTVPAPTGAPRRIPTAAVAGGGRRLRRGGGARAALLAWLLLAASGRSQPANEDERLQFADGLFSREMFELARGEYQAFLKDFPGSTRTDLVRFRLGELSRRLGDLTAAEEHYRAACARFPGSPYRQRAALRLADLCRERSQFQSALDWLDPLLGESPPPEVAAPALSVRAACLQALGRSAEAIQSLEGLSEGYPSSPYASFALLELGGLYSPREGPAGAAHDEARALRCYERAAQQPASDRVGAEALFQLAELHFRRGAYDESAQAYEQLLSRYPGDPRGDEARLQAAWAAHNAGRYAEAMRHAEQTLSAGTPTEDRAEALYLKANAQRQTGAHEAAVAAYAELLREFASSRFATSALYEQALALYRLRRYAEVVARLEPQEWPESLREDVYWLLAESHAALGQAERAGDYYRRIVAQYPGAGIACEAAYRLAFGLQGRGNLAEAAGYYEWVATNCADNPRVPAAWFAAGLCHAQEERHAEAVADWSRLLAQYPSHAAAEKASFQKAVSEMRLQRSADALASWRRFVQTFPQSDLAPEAQYWMGALLKEAGQWTEAEAPLRKALAGGLREALVPEAEFHLANVLQQSGQLQEAAERYGRLLGSPLKRRFPPSLLAWLAEYSFERKLYRDSVAAARQILENSPDDHWQQVGWGLVGRGEHAAGDPAAALDALQRCLAVKAGTRFAPESALLLGEIHRAGGDYTNAQHCFEQAARLAGSDALLEVRARAYAGLGRTAKAQHDPAQAARYFMSVAILYDDPDLVPECLFEAFQAFRQSGRTAEANTAMSELRQRYPASPWAREPAP